MGIRPTSEFNLLATPSQEWLLRIATLFVNGGSVTSIFSSIAAHGGLTEKARAAREHEREMDRVLMEMAMAPPERIAQFGQRLTRLDEGSTAALLKNEEELRAAEEELGRIRAKGFTVPNPDGRKAKVYRDGNDVRTEDGQIVEFMTGDDLPADTAEFSDLKAAADQLTALKAERKEIEEYREKIGAAQDRLDQGPVSEKELEEMKAELDGVPASVAAHINSADDGAEAEAAAASAPAKTASGTFAAAVSAISADDFAGLPAGDSPHRPGLINPPAHPSAHGPK